MLWDDIKLWLYSPFQTQGDPVNWLLLILLSTTIAFGWTRVLNKVLEE